MFFQGYHLSAVGWNRKSSSEHATGEILIGTTKGLVLETDINASEDGRFFYSTTEKYCKQVSYMQFQTNLFKAARYFTWFS